MTLRHDSSAQRYHLELDVGEAYVDYHDEDGTRVLEYCFVSPALRGRGIARELVSETFEAVMAERLPSRPTCSYIRSVARTRPEWASYFLD